MYLKSITTLFSFSGTVDYAPYIAIKNSQDCFDEYNAHDPTQEYLYYCPAESDENFKISERLCPHEQCLFLKQTTYAYEETVRCEYEIIPLTRISTVHEGKTCGELASYPVDIYFGVNIYSSTY